MELKSFLKKYENIIFLSLLSLLTFFTWFFKVNEVYNVIIYISILIGLAILKFSDLKLVIFTLFTLTANNTPEFLKFIDTIYSKIFNTNISALKSYYTFLYTAVFIVLMIILLIRNIRNKTIPKGQLIIPMVLLLIYSLITLIWTPNIIKGLSEFWFIVQGYYIYIALRNSKDTKFNLYFVSWALSLLLLVISMQYFVSYYRYFKVNDINLSFFKYFTFSSKKAINLWANPNIVASVFGVAYVPTLYKYFKSERNKLRYLYLPLELLIIYAMILGKSTGLQLAMITGIIFIPFLLIKNKKFLYYTVLTAIFIFISGIILIVSFETKYPDIYHFFNKLTTYRLDIYKIAINELKDPLVLFFGHGIGSDRVILDHVDFFHSFVFQVLVNRGLIALVLISIILYRCADILFKSTSKFKYFVGLATIIYLVHGLTDAGFEYQFIGVIFYMLYALIENDTDNNYYFEYKFERQLK